MFNLDDTTDAVFSDIDDIQMIVIIMISQYHVKLLPYELI